MGKSKRRHRSRSSENDESIRKRLKLLEQELERVKRSRSHSRHSHRARSRRRETRSPDRDDVESHSRYSRGRTSSMSDRLRDARTPTPTQSPAAAGGVREVYNTSSGGCSPRGIELDETNKERDANDDVLIINENEDLPEDIRDILGENPGQPKAPVFEIHEAIATRWSHIVTHGLSKEDRELLLEKHTTPKNCSLLSPPKINPEIKTIMSVPHITRDSTHFNYQSQLVGGLSALGKTLNVIFEEEQNMPRSVKQKLLSHLVDCGRICAGLFYDISKIRRYLITPTLNKTVKEIADNTEPGEFLFGPDIGERAKVAKTLEKTGQDLRPVPSTSRSTTQLPRFSRKKGGGQEVAMKSNTSLNRYRPSRNKREVRQTRGHYPSRQSRHQQYPTKR